MPKGTVIVVKRRNDFRHYRSIMQLCIVIENIFIIIIIIIIFIIIIIIIIFLIIIIKLFLWAVIDIGVEVFPSHYLVDESLHT